MTPRKPSQRILAGPVLRTQPDQRLVVLAREGHESALEEIVRRHRPGLVRYAASIVPPDRADDVVQDSLARSLPEIGGGEDDLRLRPWLYTIVRNAALNQLRDAGPPHEQLDENYDGVEQPPQAMERRERMRSLVAGLRGLPEAQRKALVKREMEGRSHAEIGAEMGVSTGAARQLIFRARHALRASLGSLLPMPLLRHLAESSDGGVVVAAGGGTAVAKAAIVLVAAGAVVTAGVEIQRGDRPSDARAIAARGAGGREATMPPGTASRSGAASPEVADPKAGPRHGAPGRGAPPRDENHSGPSGSLHQITSGHRVGGGPQANDQAGGGGGGLGGNDHGGPGHSGDRPGGERSIASEGGDGPSSGGGSSSGEEAPSSSGEPGSDGGEGAGTELSDGSGGGVESSSGSGSSPGGSRDSSGSGVFSGTTDQTMSAGEP